MDKKKKTYLAPDIAVTQVEIESSICGGSVDIQNPTGNQGEIEAQKVNTDFGYSYGTESWDSSPANN